MAYLTVAELLDHIFNAAYTPPATVYLRAAPADIVDGEIEAA